MVQEKTAFRFSDAQIDVFRRNHAAICGEFPAMKNNALAWGKHQDWPWNGFVLSHATNGGSNNWDKRIALVYDELYSWAALCACSHEERSKRFAVLGNPRWRNAIAQRIESNYQQFLAMGGPSGCRAAYHAKPSARARIAFLETFSGIGPKYARNIPMDCYDPLVRESFALDIRLNTILKLCGWSKKRYATSENVLRDLCSLLSIPAWDLDRTLYGRYEQIKAGLLSLPLEADL